jgi:hypothetical protein
LERKLHLPLTESGAMLEAIHRFDDRMHRILDAAGAPPTIPHGRGASDEFACALCIVILTLVATVVLALYDKVISSVFASSGGTIAVAITLITGRSSAISGKGRPNKKPSK